MSIDDALPARAPDGSGLDEPAATPSPARQRVLQAAARHARVLADPIRLAILEQLQHGSFSVRELAASLGISEPAASKHAALLSEHGLLERERHGRHVVCRRRAQGEDALHALVGSAIAAGADLLKPLQPIPTSADMTGLDPEDVEFMLSMACTAFRVCGGNEAEWRFNVVRLFGSAVEPKLPVMWAAVQRVAAGLPLDGLALPPVLLEAPGLLYRT